MKVIMFDKDGVKQSRHINQKNFDPKRMMDISEKNIWRTLDDSH